MLWFLFQHCPKVSCAHKNLLPIPPADKINNSIVFPVSTVVDWSYSIMLVNGR